MSITKAFKFGEDTLTFSFNANETYPNTGLGCHTGALGSLSLTIAYKGDAFYSKPLHDRWDAIRKSDMATQIADYLVNWTKENTIGSYKRSHFIISANYASRKSPPYSDWYVWRTYDIMDIIMEHCDRDPAKYGTYVVSEFTENMAHGTGAVSRTMVWIPPHVPRKDKPQGNWRSLLKPEPVVENEKVEEEQLVA